MIRLFHPYFLALESSKVKLAKQAALNSEIPRQLIEMIYFRTFPQRPVDSEHWQQIVPHRLQEIRDAFQHEIYTKVLPNLTLEEARAAHNTLIGKEAADYHSWMKLTALCIAHKDSIEKTLFEKALSIQKAWENPYK